MGMKVLIIVQHVLFAGVPLAEGHAYLFEPVSRNMASATENCPHCGQGNGVTTVKDRAGGQWPTKDAYGSHGLCGDPFQGKAVTPLEEEKYLVETMAPQRTYTAGSSVMFLVYISTHHMGHFEFRICDRQLDANLASHQEGQECLDQWVLERVPPEEVYGDCVVNDPRGDCQPVDENHPGRWYLPPGGMMETVTGTGWSAEAIETFSANGGGSVYSMWYKIPETLACTRCTLQWYWSSGNNCLYDASYFEYFRGMEALGWSAEAWAPFAVADWATCENRCCGNAGLWGEEFWNCADIEVIRSGPTAPPTPTFMPTPRPTYPVTLSPTWMPTAPTPPTTPAPTPVPMEVYQCFYAPCGCPGAWLLDWCTVEDAKYGDWCQESESNCLGCGGGHWCPQEPTPQPTPPPTTPRPTAAPTARPTAAPTSAPTMCDTPGNGASTCKGWCPKNDTAEYQRVTKCENPKCSTCCVCQESEPEPEPEPTAEPTAAPTGSSGLCYHSDCGCPPFDGGAFCCTVANALMSNSCNVNEIACAACAGSWCAS